MVTEYGSEEEQVEAIKRWLRSHGPSIIAGIVIGLALIGGWRFWTSYQLSQAEGASQEYETLVAVVARNDLAQTQIAATRLQNDYADSAYALLAALQLAKLAVEQNDNATAISALEWASANATDPSLAAVARLRLARVLLAEDRIDDAKARLDSVDNNNFTAAVEELRGDVYFADRQIELARTAYQAAQAAAGPGGASSLLQLKLDSLPVADTATDDSATADETAEANTQ